VSRVPGLEGVSLKFEGSLASGSFKDRVMHVLVEEAVRRGARGAVVASSGNAAIAASASCAATGLPLLILVPTTTAAERTLPSELRGAAVIRTGDDPSEVFSLAAELAAKFDLADLASTFASPGCEWACRQIGWELSEQVAEEINTVICPISVGPVLVGTGHGLVEAGRRLPALVGVQASACAPIVAAFEGGLERVEPWVGPVTTRAVAIADRLRGYAGDGTYTLAEIRRSGGLALSVDDHEIEEMRSMAEAGAVG
jgi:threonine synthase